MFDKTVTVTIASENSLNDIKTLWAILIIKAIFRTSSAEYTRKRIGRLKHLHIFIHLILNSDLIVTITILLLLSLP